MKRREFIVLSAKSIGGFSIRILGTDPLFGSQPLLPVRFSV